MAIKKSVGPADLVYLLNQATELDPEAMLNLLGARVVCNQDLADHPTIQVGRAAEDQPFTVGMLGILNGLFGIRDDGEYQGHGVITAMFDPNAPEPGKGLWFFLTEEVPTMRERIDISDGQT